MVAEDIERNGRGHASAIIIRLGVLLRSHEASGNRSSGRAIERFISSLETQNVRSCVRSLGGLKHMVLIHVITRFVQCH